MLENSELGTFMALVEDEVEAVVALDPVEIEDTIEDKEAVVKPVILIFLSMWTTPRLMSHSNNGAS